MVDGDVRGSAGASRRLDPAKDRVGRPVDDLVNFLAKVAPFAVILLLLVGVWTLGGGVVRDNGWFCGTTNKNGTTVTLPAEPMVVEEYDRFLKEQNGCATLEIELTVTGVWSPNTVIEPLGQSVAFTAGEPIPVRVEASAREFWLECGDFTGARAANFPNFSATSKGCDPSIETRCKPNEALGLCAEIGNNGQRCLTSDGHIHLACGDNPDTCLDQDGRFVACDE